MSEVEKYVIDGVVYTQTFPTLGDVKKLVTAFEDFDLSNLTAGSLFSALLKHNLLQDFFNIILKGEKEINADVIDFDVAVEIISDFLSSLRFSKMLSMIYLIVENLTGGMNNFVSKITANSTGTISSP